MTNPTIGRRKFLKLPIAAAIGSSPLLSLMMHAGTARAAGIDQDYKALVCIFLAGGNDSFNMIVPRSDAAYTAYATARQDLAVARDDLFPLTPSSYYDGTRYGFHLKMPEVAQLFTDNRLAIIANAGTLAQPLTKDQYETGTAQLPPQLFSHSDQQQLWMTADAVSAKGVGWGGAMADILYPNAFGAPIPSPSITIAGSNLWQVGRRTSQYDIPSWGVYPLDLSWHEGGYKMDQAYRDVFMLGVGHQHKLVAQYARVQQRSEDYSALIGSALDGTTEFSTPFPGELYEERGDLGAQLKMVAKLLGIRGQLGAETGRQVFFVRFHGWDTHDNQNNSHPQLLLHLSKAMNAFDAVLSELAMQDQVTTFTASEFGRSLTPNNNGTDHGWGGHSLVMGGAVNGGDIYGTMPRIELDSPDAVEDGRIIPTTSVDQYAATLARWFGLTETGIDMVFPNLGNFATRDIGFMQPPSR